MINSFSGKYTFLSNFYMVNFVVDGITYKSSEHFYMSKKSKSEAYVKSVLEAKTSGHAKRLGRSVVLREDWERIKIHVMYKAIYHKFNQNPDILRQLLRTTGVMLIEGNQWHDNYWGDCYCAKCNNIVGQNQLGFTLMGIRSMFPKITLI